MPIDALGSHGIERQLLDVFLYMGSQWVLYLLIGLSVMFCILCALCASALCASALCAPLTAPPPTTAGPPTRHPPPKVSHP